jgi:hypothetical protein
MLFLDHSKGSMEVPIWRIHDAQLSMRTVIQFLNSVRTDTIALPQPDWAVAASSDAAFKRVLSSFADDARYL